MKLFTASNRTYSNLLALWIERAKAFDLPFTVYDLGWLGFGVPWHVHDDEFQDAGHYSTPHPRYKARALHKPGIVLDHLTRFGGGCYLDADALLLGPLDLPEEGWDLAVTVRRSQESYGADVHEFIGEINAGVMFFQKTPALLEFVGVWQGETVRHGSDQRALNVMLGGDLPRDGSIVERAGVRVKCLSTDEYNFYYRPEMPPPSARVLHLKGMSWAEPECTAWVREALSRFRPRGSTGISGLETGS